MGVRADYFLDCAGESATQTIANVLLRIEPVLIEEMPDAVVVYGDTNSCLAIIAAKRLQIPIFHFEAGNRSFDSRVPEELNRKIVDHLSDINFVLTEHARRYLLAEGLHADRIFRLGGHMLEVINKHERRIQSSEVLRSSTLKAKSIFWCRFIVKRMLIMRKILSLW